MKIQGLALAAVLSTIGLIACSKTAPPADSLPTSPAATAPAATDAPAATPTTAASLTVEPGQVHACDGQDRIISKVSWRVDDPAVTTVRVEVDSATEPKRNTFASGGATGQESTGLWVVAGVRFHLIDNASNNELATYEVTSLPCE